MSMLGNLNLQKKAVISFSIVIAVACIILSVLGYNAASNGFGKALEMKAASDSKTVNEILDLKYEGAWEVRTITCIRAVRLWMAVCPLILWMG